MAASKRVLDEEVDFDAMDDDAFAEYYAAEETKRPSISNDNADDAVEEPEEEEDEVEPDTEEEDSDENESELSQAPAPKEKTSSGKKKMASESELEEDIEPEYAVSQMRELLSEFKANGIQMRVKDVNEARTLMQMGANYSKKMSEIKPHLRRVQTLEKNKITDEDLNLLVDLKRGDKSAVKKLLADHKIDPIDLDLEETPEYKENDYSVSKAQYELNSALDEIRNTSSYHDTIRVVGTEWDEGSREVISRNPEILKGINNQMANGDFKIIQTAITRERALGRLSDITDLEAYVQVYNQLKSEADTGKPANQSKSQQGRQSNDRTDTQASARNRARAAASSTTSKSKTAPVTAKNLYALSDEEFEKDYGSKFSF